VTIDNETEKISYLFFQKTNFTSLINSIFQEDFGVLSFENTTRITNLRVLEGFGWFLRKGKILRISVFSIRRSIDKSRA